MTTTIIELKCPGCGHLIGKEEYELVSGKNPNIQIEKIKNECEERIQKFEQEIEKIIEKHREEAEFLMLFYQGQNRMNQENTHTNGTDEKCMEANEQ